VEHMLTSAPFTSTLTTIWFVATSQPD